MSLESLNDFKIAEKIKTIVPPILLTVGLVGNVLSIVVLSQANNRKTSTGVMLIALAVTDILILISSVLINWIAFMFEIDFRNSSNAGCKLHVFITYLLLQLSAWILVFVTMERVVSVTFPHRVRDLFTRKRALVAMGIFVLFLAGLNGHLLYGLEKNVDSSLCQVTEKHKHFMFKIWTWIDFAFAFAIPFCVLLAGNITVVFKLKSSQNFRTRSTRPASGSRKLSNSSKSQRDRERTTTYFTITAIILNISFMVLVSPFVIFAIGQPYWFTEESMTLERHANLILIGTVTQMLMYTNNVINFILYVLCGTKFRRDLLNLLCFHRRKQRSSSVNTTGSRSFQSISVISRSSTLSVSECSDRC